MPLFWRGFKIKFLKFNLSVLILFLFILFFVPLVFSYIPVLSYNYDFLDDEGVFQFNVSYASFNSSYYVLNNYSNFNNVPVRVNDGFVNNNSSVLLVEFGNVSSFVVNPYNSFVFDNTGVYVVKYFNNNSFIGSFKVFNSSDVFVFKPFSYDLIFVPNNYSFNNFSLGDFLVLNFSIKDYEGVPPNSYPFNFKIFYNNNLYSSFDDDLFVPKNYNFSVFPKSVNFSFLINSSFNLSFKIFNNANFKPLKVDYKIFNLSFLDENNGSFKVFDYYDFLIFKNNNVVVKPDLYKGFIVFSDEKNHRVVVPVNITFKDVSKPKIYDFKVFSNFTFVDNKVFFSVKDDYKVVKVNATANGVLVYNNSSVFCSDCIFSFPYNFYEDTEFVFCAVDFSNNTFCKSFDFKPLKFNLYVFNSSVFKFKTSKIKVYNDFNVFNITESNVPINISLKDVDFSFLDDANISRDDFFNYFTIGFVDGDGSFYRFNNFNDKVVLKNKGEVFLRIKSYNQSDLFGYFVVNTPDFFNNSNKTFQFDARFRNYKVDKTIFSSMFGDIPFNCKVNDTGVYETSNIVCKAVYPLDFNFQNNVVPISKKQFDGMKKDFEKKILYEKHKFKVLLFVFLGFLLFYFFTIIFFYFYHNKDLIKLRLY